MKSTVVTGNGLQLLNKATWGSSSIIYSGSLNGATVKMQIDGVDLVDGSILENDQIKLNHGHGANIFILVSGFTSDFSINTTVA